MSKIWVLDAYMNESGWDGQHQQVFYESAEHAEAAKKAMEQAMKTVNKTGDDRDLELEIFEVFPVPKDITKKVVINNARQILAEWLEE